MTESDKRDVVFISKATPGDDEFALWLAPRLEAAGYKVFADIRVLDGGDRWRKDITDTLQNRAIKMLLCCSDETLAREGVQEEIEIAMDLVKSIPDPKFIIPLRMRPYKKLFGIGGLQYVDFVRGWGNGLEKLLSTLKSRKVPCDLDAVQINPNWEAFRLRGAIPVKREPERLTSNWLRIAEAPDSIRFYEATGAVDRFAIGRTCEVSPFPAQPHGFGFFTFASEDAVAETFGAVAKFHIKTTFPLVNFVEEGAETLGLKRQDTSNMVHSMFRQAWNAYCRERGLLEYTYSNAVGFHASKDQGKIAARIPWGKQGERRWSMLRNVSKGHVWQYGVSALPAFWPYPHFKLKSRVIFAPYESEEAGTPYDDAKKQHRLRRSICKGWRNKQWRGRLLAYLELLSGESAFLRLPLASDAHIVLEAFPLLFTSPVSTVLPDALTDDQEEADVSTLGRSEPEENE